MRRRGRYRERAYETSLQLVCACRRLRILEDGLLQPLGVEPEFLGHLDEFLGGLGIPDGTGQTPGSDGLVAIVVGFGHGNTFPR